MRLPVRPGATFITCSARPAASNPLARCTLPAAKGVAAGELPGQYSRCRAAALPVMYVNGLHDDFAVAARGNASSMATSTL